MTAFEGVLLLCFIAGMVRFVDFNIDYIENPDSPAMAVKLVKVFNWVIIFVICAAAAALIVGFSKWLMYF